MLSPHLCAMLHHFLVTHAAVLRRVMLGRVVSARCLMLLHHLAMTHHLFMAHAVMPHPLSRRTTT